MFQPVRASTVCVVKRAWRVSGNQHLTVETEETVFNRAKFMHNSEEPLYAATLCRTDLPRKLKWALLRYVSFSQIFML